MCLAGLLACEPSVLVLDEPTSGLDPRGRRELKALLRAIPATQLIATHDLELVAELCGRTLVMDGGRIVAQGDTIEILSNEKLMLAPRFGASAYSGRKGIAAGGSMKSNPQTTRWMTRGAMFTALMASECFAVDRVQVPFISPTSQPAPALVRPPATRSASGSHADVIIRTAEAKIAKLPVDPVGYVELATGFMLKARETADGAYYGRAEAACGKALALKSDHYPAVRLLAWIAGGQHRFRDATDAARRAIAIDPRDPWNYGTLADALIELGDYDAAEKAVQAMADLNPGPPALIRIGYLRELFGDPDGAIEVLSSAARSMGAREPEPFAWCHTQLGHLSFNTGHLSESEAEYRLALSTFPNYYAALTGLGRTLAGMQRFDEAITSYKHSLKIVPTHDAAVGLADLLVSLKRNDEATQPFALVEVIETLNRANNVRPDASMAMYLADHDLKLPESLKIARERFEEKQDIRTLDALAWALYKNGQYTEAAKISAQALRLGTKDPAMLFRAGMIHAQSGQTKEAVEQLQAAMNLNPFFDPIHAPEARETLLRLNADPAGRRL